MKPLNAFLDACKATVRSGLQPIARGLNQVSGGRLHPDVLTLTSLIMHLPIAWLIANDHLVWAALGLVVFGLFDALDGALARLQHRESARGMLLDSVTDKVKEVMLYTGVAANVVLIGRADMVYWVVIACGASICVSYVNAWGEVVSAGRRTDEAAINQAFRSGLARYEVRMALLVAGLLTSQLVFVSVLIGLLSITTIIERFVKVSRQL